MLPTSALYPTLLATSSLAWDRLRDDSRGAYSPLSLCRNLAPCIQRWCLQLFTNGFFPNRFFYCCWQKVLFLLLLVKSNFSKEKIHVGKKTCWRKNMLAQKTCWQKVTLVKSHVGKQLRWQTSVGKSSVGKMLWHRKKGAVFEH